MFDYYADRNIYTEKIFDNIEWIQTTNLMICHFETNTIFFFQKFYYISDGIEDVFVYEPNFTATVLYAIHLHKHNFVYPFV